MYGLIVNGENVCISGADTPLFEMDCLNARWMTYQIAVEKLNGAPTTATLVPAFQGLVISGQNNFEGQYGTSSNIPWYDLDATSCMTAAGFLDIVPGGTMPTIATQTFVNTTPVTPKVYMARIRGGFPHRLMLRGAFSGGTTPSWQVSIWANQEF